MRYVSNIRNKAKIVRACAYAAPHRTFVGGIKNDTDNGEHQVSYVISPSVSLAGFRPLIAATLRGTATRPSLDIFARREVHFNT
ncbi:hypothetical protein PUN28_007743 [Cardiocondyla obscurior]|uniref:Uncharacterized protein n=1 Tax=Cardiocondyla obscurior TaxID=286306 RepID=A0AAW2G035_9HYME